MSAKYKIAIVGDGILTELILSTSLKQIDADTSQILVFSQNSERTKILREEYNAQTTSESRDLSEISIVVLSMNDSEANKILPEIKSSIRPDAMVMSAIHGWNIAKLESIFPTQAIIRLVMTPAVVNRAGMTAYVVGKSQSLDADNFAQMAFSRIGKVMKIETESELEKISEIFMAGSIASFFSIREMIRGAIRAGISEQRAKEIIDQIVRGELDLETKPDEIVDDLRRKSLDDQDATVFIEEGISLIHKYGIWNFLRV